MGITPQNASQTFNSQKLLTKWSVAGSQPKVIKDQWSMYFQSSDVILHIYYVKYLKIYLTHPTLN